MPDSPPLPAGAVADRAVVDKSERTLTLFRRGRALKAYRLSLGGAPEGHMAAAVRDSTPIEIRP